MSTESAHLRHQCETGRRGENDDLEALLVVSERGIEVIQETGHETEAQP
jgi:hypothetical protein